MKHSPQPYRWAIWLITKLAAPHLKEELLGDLDELFHARAQRLGYIRARLWHLLDILLLVHPRLWRKQKTNYDIKAIISPIYLHPGMLRNYFKIALRNLVKNKTYSLINTGGLAIGIACCLAIGLYVYDEYSFDRFHANAPNIYRVVEKQNQAGTIYDVASTPAPLSSTLKAEFAEIKDYCRFDRYWGILEHNTTMLEPEDMLVVDPSFFTLFNFQLIQGNPQKVLQSPDEIIINESMTEKFFGSNWRSATGLIGQTFKLKGKAFRLTGIAKNAPHNSHIQFNVLFPFRLIEQDTERYQWNNDSQYNYLLLDPEANVEALNKKIFGFMTKYRPFDKPTISLQPMLDIYLNPDFDFHTDWPTKGSRLYIWVFMAVGLIVLAIALFNFMNLATARAMKRAKEVGVRKAIGAVRGQLIVQFMGESFLMTLLAMMFSLALLILFLPLLNNVSAKELAVPFSNPFFWLILIALSIVISLLAGMYPSLYLSRFIPVKVLKGVFDVYSGKLFRRTLVVSQFVMSVMLITGAIVIYRQLMFIQDRNLGFNKSQLLHVWIRTELKARQELIKTELNNQSSIVQASLATGNMVDMGNSTYDFEWEGKAKEEGFVITHMNTDPEFLTTTGLKLAAGRNFNPAIQTDTADAYLINETAARRMRWTPQQALGKTLTFWGKKGKVIGVVKDFHYKPLTAAIEPFLFRYWPKTFYTAFVIKTQPGQAREAIAAVENIYKKYKSVFPPYYGFVDQSLDALYRTEQRTGRVVLYFSVLAILVSCLGLFGLVTFTAEQRTKEIGIRKVLGATASHIVALLSKDFLYLILLSIIIATPIAWYAMNQWLADFAYKTSIEWWVFVLSGVLAAGVAMLTISFQAVKAALINPVKTLKSE